MAIFRVSLALAAIAVSVPFIATPAQAAGPQVEIVRIRYDSPGSDRGGRASVNAEYIRFRNTTRKTIDLQGWYLRDDASRYTFGEVALRPGRTLTLRSGTGRDSDSTLYWGRHRYVWNNTADLALLRTHEGELVDACSYKDARESSTTCPGRLGG